MTLLDLLKSDSLIVLSVRESDDVLALRRLPGGWWCKSTFEPDRYVAVEEIEGFISRLFGQEPLFYLQFTSERKWHKLEKNDSKTAN